MNGSEPCATAEMISINSSSGGAPSQDGPLTVRDHKDTMSASCEQAAPLMKMKCDESKVVKCHESADTETLTSSEVDSSVVNGTGPDSKLKNARQLPSESSKVHDQDGGELMENGNGTDSTQSDTNQPTATSLTEPTSKCGKNSPVATPKERDEINHFNLPSLIGSNSKQSVNISISESNGDVCDDSDSNQARSQVNGDKEPSLQQATSTNPPEGDKDKVKEICIQGADISKTKSASSQDATDPQSSSLPQAQCPIPSTNTTSPNSSDIPPRATSSSVVQNKEHCIVQSNTSSPQKSACLLNSRSPEETGGKESLSTSFKNKDGNQITVLQFDPEILLSEKEKKSKQDASSIVIKMEKESLEPDENVNKVSQITDITKKAHCDEEAHISSDPSNNPSSTDSNLDSGVNTGGDTIGDEGDVEMVDALPGAVSVNEGSNVPPDEVDLGVESGPESLTGMRNVEDGGVSNDGACKVAGEDKNGEEDTVQILDEGDNKAEERKMQQIPSESFKDIKESAESNGENGSEINLEGELSSSKSTDCLEVVDADVGKCKGDNQNVSQTHIIDESGDLSHKIGDMECEAMQVDDEDGDNTISETVDSNAPTGVSEGMQEEGMEADTSDKAAAACGSEEDKVGEGNRDDSTESLLDNKTVENESDVNMSEVATNVPEDVKDDVCPIDAKLDNDVIAVEAEEAIGMGNLLEDSAENKDEVLKDEEMKDEVQDLDRTIIDKKVNDDKIESKRPVDVKKEDSSNVKDEFMKVDLEKSEQRKFSSKVELAKVEVKEDESKSSGDEVKLLNGQVHEDEMMKNGCAIEEAMICTKDVCDETEIYTKVSFKDVLKPTKDDTAPLNENREVIKRNNNKTEEEDAIVVEENGANQASQDVKSDGSTNNADDEIIKKDEKHSQSTEKSDAQSVDDATRKRSLSVEETRASSPKRSRVDSVITKAEEKKGDNIQVEDDDTVVLMDSDEEPEPSKTQDIPSKGKAESENIGNKTELTLTSAALRGLILASLKTVVQTRKVEKTKALEERMIKMESANTLWKESAKHLERSVEELTRYAKEIEKKRIQSQRLKHLSNRSVGVQVQVSSSNPTRPGPQQPPRPVVQPPPPAANQPTKPDSQPGKQAAKPQHRSATLSLPPSFLLNHNGQQSPSSTNQQGAPVHRPPPRHSVPQQQRPMGMPPHSYTHQNLDHRGPRPQRNPQNTTWLPQTPPPPYPHQSRPQTNNQSNPAARNNTSGPPVVNLIDLTDEDDSRNSSVSHTNPPQRAKGLPPSNRIAHPQTNNSQRIAQNPGYHQEVSKNLPSTPGGRILASSGGNVRITTPRGGGAQQQGNRPGIHSQPPSSPVQGHPAPFPKDKFSLLVPSSARKLPPKPTLKISRVDKGIVLSWNMQEVPNTETIASYQLFAYQESSSLPTSAAWKKVGDVKALPLPMACTLTQFQEGNKYYFAVRALDQFGRWGEYSEPSSIYLFPDGK